MVNSPSIGFSDFDVRDARKVALRVEQRLLIGSVEIGPVDRAREISDEHPTAFQIQGHADAFHKIGEHDFGRCAVARRSIERRAVYRVAARRVPTVRPVQRARGRIDIQIDWLGQPVIYQFNVLAIRRRLAGWSLDFGAGDPPRARIVTAFLCPVKFPALDIEGDAYAPLPQIRSRSGIALARIDEGLEVRTIKVDAHHAHAFTVAPIELAVFLIELDLLRSERAAFGNNHLTIVSVKVGPLDGAIVEIKNSHIGPVDMVGCSIDRYPVRVAAIGYDDLPVAPLRGHRVDATATQLKHEQSAHSAPSAGPSLFVGAERFRHVILL